MFPLVRYKKKKKGKEIARNTSEKKKKKTKLCKWNNCYHFSLPLPWQQKVCMETPDLRPFQADTAEQSHIDFPGPKVGQFKATNNCNSHFCWLTIYESNLTQTKFMNGTALGLLVLSLTNRKF